MNENQYVVFELAGEYYAIKIDTVETIERDNAITRVPKTPVYVAGVINLRGEIVPVIDLRLRLGLQKKDMDSESRIIVNKMDDMMIGYIVDSTYEVKVIEQSQIDYSGKDETVNETYVKAIARDNDRMIILLDVDKVLSK